MLPPWLSEAPDILYAVDPLGDDADVVVIGGGLAGLAAARLLALGGARVAVFEARAQLGGGFSTRAPGLVLASLGEHPGRLVGSVGQAAAAEMHAFMADNRAILDELGLLRHTGSLAVGAMEGEGEEISRSLDLLPFLGVACEGRRGEQVAAALSSHGLSAGRFVPDDGVVDVVEVLSLLAAQARQAGATLHPGHPVTALEEEADGWHTRGDGFDLRADAAILAAGHGLRDLVPWFSTTVLPVRHQWIATASLRGEARLPMPVLAHHGLSHWLSVGDRVGGDRVVAGGARFGAAAMEHGQADDTVINDQIDHILRHNLARSFPDLALVPITHAWSAIATHSCDGLPLIGPLPGRVHLVACTAFHALDHGLALRAGQAVAEGLLTGRAQGVPRLFKPGRLV